ncbi:hypothetical protein ACFWAP_08970 [Streptomyces goshikiensis]|uniref:TRADD-N-associated membrane domain-containing protein n=1 Tax=Streptomyces goshikiensis TaxID=1942 RepID=UPI0036481979
MPSPPKPFDRILASRLFAVLAGFLTPIGAVIAVLLAINSNGSLASTQEQTAGIVGSIITVTLALGFVRRGAALRLEEGAVFAENVQRLDSAELHVVQAIAGEALLAGQLPEGDQVRDPRARPDQSLLTLSALWEATHARLRVYHNLALKQADQSFRSAKWAMWLGFLALGGFVAVALRASTTAGAIVAGGLGAVAAGLAGFIGKTFVRSQEAAAEHLRAYFDQPLELSRYLAAERLIADAALSSEQRAEALTAIVTAMVAGPQPLPTAPPPTPGIPQQTAAE